MPPPDRKSRVAFSVSKNNFKKFLPLGTFCVSDLGASIEGHYNMLVPPQLRRQLNILPREDTGYGTCHNSEGSASCRGGRREITLRKDRRASRQYPAIRGQASVGTYRKQADRRSLDDANFLLHDLCNSGRCGDNTGILLRCRTFDF